MTPRNDNPTTDHNPEDTLDAILCGWAASHDRSLSESEVSSLVDAISLRSETPVVRRMAPSRTVRYLAGLTIAASLLFVATWRLLQNGPSLPNDGYALVSLQEEDVSRQRRLVRGVYDLFGDRLSWLAVAPEGLQMGIDESPQPLALNAPDNAWRQFTALRFVMLRRQETGGPWETVQELDVLAPLEQVVSLQGVRLDQQRGFGQTDLRVWSFLLPDGGVAVDVEGELPVFGALENGSRVLQPGAVTTIAGATVDGWQYQLLHTAVVIDIAPDGTGV